jgi:hypothetical protein
MDSWGPRWPGGERRRRPRRSWFREQPIRDPGAPPGGHRRGAPTGPGAAGPGPRATGRPTPPPGPRQDALHPIRRQGQARGTGGLSRTTTPHRGRRASRGRAAVARPAPRPAPGPGLGIDGRRSPRPRQGQGEQGAAEVPDDDGPVSEWHRPPPRGGAGHLVPRVQLDGAAPAADGLVALVAPVVQLGEAGVDVVAQVGVGLRGATVVVEGLLRRAAALGQVAQVPVGLRPVRGSSSAACW